MSETAWITINSLKLSKTGPLLQGIISFKIIENQLKKKGNLRLNVTFHVVLSTGLYTEVKSRNERTCAKFSKTHILQFSLPDPLNSSDALPLLTSTLSPKDYKSLVIWFFEEIQGAVALFDGRISICDWLPLGPFRDPSLAPPGPLGPRARSHMWPLWPSDYGPDGHGYKSNLRQEASLPSF
jgi:hypothetical protein